MFIKVIGSGTPEVNGLYVDSGTLNGKARFIDSNNHEIIWDGYEWNIQVVGASGALYDSSDDVATPDLVKTWTANNGAQPVPSVEVVEFPDLKIKGSGIAKVNACYTAYDISNGKPKYGLKANHIMEDSVYIGYSGDAWVIIGKIPTIGKTPTIVRYYFSYDSVDTPDLVTTWEKDKDGVLPLPTFVLGCVKFIPSSSKAVKRN